MATQADVLIVTVNENETQSLLQAFQAATGSAATPIPIDGRLYRDLGAVNGSHVFHALSEMGSAGPGGTLQTVDKGIRALNPGAVIAVGIAFGVNEKKQSIGDILLSRQLRLYDLQRAGHEIILRGDRPHASARLLNFFGAAAQTSWTGARVQPGVILSGDKLVDNFDYRAQLLALEPEAVGGEMEGAGLYVASLDHKVDWIVIKAICDWADGTKAKNKARRQKKAAKNAAEFVLHSLQHAKLPAGDRPLQPDKPEDDTDGDDADDLSEEKRELLIAAYFDHAGSLTVSFDDKSLIIEANGGWSHQDDSQKRYTAALESLCYQGLLKLAAGEFKGQVSLSFAVKVVDGVSIGQEMRNKAIFEITPKGKFVARKHLENEADEF